MIADCDTNIVFISDQLPHRHPAIVPFLEDVLGDRLKVIPGTKDIWCRDFMPIQLAQDRFVQFRYAPDYLVGDPELRTDNGAALIDLNGCVRSNVVIDGGNVVHRENSAILTDKVYDENAGIERRRLREKLRSILEVEHLVVVPKEPGDIFGHTDGMVRFVDEKTVLVNDYRKVDPGFGEKLRNVLKGFEIVPFPYAPVEKGIWGVEPALGVYINFLQMKGIIICPTFGFPDDDNALNVLERCFPKEKIIPLRCNELAMGGGILNCVTWNIKTAERSL